MPTTSDEQPIGLSTLLTTIADESDGTRVSIEKILDIIGTSAHGPLLVVPALIAIAPTGAIPGMSIVTGTIILLVSVQMLISAHRIWVPSRIKSIEISREKLTSATHKVVPYLKKIDGILQQRLTVLTTAPSTQLIAVLCMLLASTMYPLALVPFAVSVPAAAVLLFGIGLTARDGAIILMGFIFTAATAVFSLSTLT